MELASPVSLLREGSAARRAAFDRLYTEFSTPIFSYLFHAVGDADRAADIAQDTFIKAFRKLDTLSSATSTRAWIYRIATNTAIDEIRRRRHTTRLVDGEDQPLQPADTGPGPEAQAIGRVLDERIGRALRRLRPNHRQCLLLSDLEEMNARQIGEVMGMSPGAVRVLLCRARGEMRRQLASEGLVR